MNVLLFKELITRFFTILLVLGALHVTAEASASVDEDKTDKNVIEATATVESDSTEAKETKSTGVLDRIASKTVEKKKELMLKNLDLKRCK